MCADQKEIKKAENFVKQAKKEEKKSFFHNPEFGDAASHYEKAGEIFYAQKMLKEAKQCFILAGKNYHSDGQSLSSGKSYSLAAKSAFAADDPGEVIRLCQESKIEYLEGDQGNQAVRVMKDFAIKLHDKYPKASFELYDSLLEVVETEEKYHWEKDSFVDFAILCYEMKNYEECFKAWDRAKKAFLKLNNTDAAAHCLLSKIAIHLERNDIVAAQKAYTEAMQEDYFVKTQDFNCIDMIFRGVKNHDGDLLEIGQKNVVLQFIKPEIARIICSFTAPKSSEQDEPQPAAQQTHSIVQPIQANDDSEGSDKNEQQKEEEPKKDEDEDAWLL